IVQRKITVTIHSGISAKGDELEKLTSEKKAEYIKENLDKKKLYVLDEELMKKMSDLYDKNLQ
ncbi:MAG: hypothetical protein K2J76_00900, partial [Oscillospiraceae bacterium]|nr:hypothetical protein [Oscillospiraceae bacterium]